jgi:hypothetical protein
MSFLPVKNRLQYPVLELLILFVLHNIFFRVKFHYVIWRLYMETPKYFPSTIFIFLPSASHVADRGDLPTRGWGLERL